MDGDEDKRRYGKRSCKDRSKLRSHVMLATCEEKRRKQIHCEQQRSPSPSTTTTLAWGINNRRADPFDALPIPGSPEIDSVIQYCKPTPPPHRPPR
ncbi:uncharacterized protein LTHEOB_1208 [Neofusicoccum parvum]|nr:uncharacterized protein LTHEOB_1208 [Neofusicoccum parvum]